MKTGELGMMTKLGSKFDFGSQNGTLRVGRTMQCVFVITVSSKINENESFIRLPKAMRNPNIFTVTNDSGETYKIGNTNSNSDEIKALYNAGLPAGIYRGSFMYITVE